MVMVLESKVRAGRGARSAFPTAGELARLLARDRERAAAVLLRAATVAARTEGLPGRDADDAAQTAVVRLIHDGGARLRDVEGATTLLALLRGYVTRIGHELRRARGPALLGSADVHVPDIGRPDAASDDPTEAPRPPVPVLPATQRHVVDLVASGMSLADAATILGITTRAAKQRAARAARAAVRRRAPQPPPGPGWSEAALERVRAAAARHRSWAGALLQAPPVDLSADDRNFLERLARGDFVAEIARDLRRSPDAVRSRMRRWKFTAVRRDA